MLLFLTIGRLDLLCHASPHDMNLRRIFVPIVAIVALDSTIYMNSGILSSLVKSAGTVSFDLLFDQELLNHQFI